MGNCIGASKQVIEDEDYGMKLDYDQDNHHHHQEEEEEEQEEEELEEKNGFGKESGNKIKIVLTKEELEWLMFELNTNKGKKLEHVLQEIERERERNKIKVWKPSLESIIECP